VLEVLYTAEQVVKAMKVVRLPVHPDDKISLAPYIDFRVKMKKKAKRVQKTHRK
jgi:hypothetical protein